MIKVGSQSIKLGAQGTVKRRHPQSARPFVSGRIALGRQGITAAPTPNGGWQVALIPAGRIDIRVLAVWKMPATDQWLFTQHHERPGRQGRPAVRSAVAAIDYASVQRFIR